MIKIQRSMYIIFIAIVIQTLLGMSLGLTMLYFSSRSHIASNVYVGELHLGGLHREEAIQKIESKYKAIIQNQSFKIKFDNNKEFVIKYRDIDATLDSEGTVSSSFGNNMSEEFVNLFKGYFSQEKRTFPLLISFNEGKLKEKLNELSDLIDRKPIDAYISMKEGKVVKNPEINGLELNIENAVQRIKSEIGNSIGGQIEFKEARGYELETITPQYTMYDLEGLDEVISQHSTKISNLEHGDSLIQAAFAISGVKVPCADYKKGLEAADFSFNKHLLDEGGIIKENDEGYNQVASTLYAAVLKAGIDLKYIQRTPHRNTVDYIQPGLDAVAVSENYDFKFTNSLDYSILIYSEIQNNSLTVSIIGKKKQPQMSSVLETEVVQKYTPTIEYLENQDMAVGEKKMITSGKEGVKVKVYRVVMDGAEVIKREYLYEDKYDAVKAIVEIGPNTHWGDEAIK